MEELRLKSQSRVERELVILCLTLVCVCIGFTCDRAHPPVVDNHTEDVIHVELRYHTGPWVQVDLGPGTQLWSPPGDLRIVEIRLSRGTQLWITASEADLAALLERARQEEGIAWVIQSDGLRAMSIDDWVTTQRDQRKGGRR